jgi:hypothetical protein
MVATRAREREREAEERPKRIKDNEEKVRRIIKKRHGQVV